MLQLGARRAAVPAAPPEQPPRGTRIKAGKMPAINPDTEVPIAASESFQSLPKG
jgi:hypothetical protein